MLFRGVEKNKRHVTVICSTTVSFSNFSGILINLSGRAELEFAYSAPLLTTTSLMYGAQSNIADMVAGRQGTE